MRAAAIIALAVVALAGCGGGSTTSRDESRVRSTVERWIEAVTDHDDRAACAELSTALRARIERHLLGEGVAGSCRTWAAKYVSPRHPASHRNAQITGVQIHGTRATVTLDAPGVPDGAATLVKENGRWRIDNY